MLAEIYIAVEVNQTKLTKACEKMDMLKSKPCGTRELIWAIEENHSAKSYCNNRLMWLAWKLEEAGIRVKWREC